MVAKLFCQGFFEIMFLKAKALSETASKKHISTTDPDASITRRGKGRSKLRYQIHRRVDEKCQVITATEVTHGEVHESHRMQSIIDKHQENTGRTLETVVAVKGELEGLIKIISNGTALEVGEERKATIVKHLERLCDKFLRL